MVLRNNARRLLTGTIVIAAATIAGHLIIAAPPTAAPPSTQPAAVNPLPPLATSPLAGGKPTVVPVPYQPYLPSPAVAHDPRMLPKDSLRPLHAEPALDVPPLAQGGLALPAEAELPVGPPTRIASSDPATPPVATIAAKPDLGVATLGIDPTASLAPAGALLLFAPPRTNQPPILFLAIPDPSHQVGYIATNAASVQDPPASDFDRPGPTTLPVKP